MNEHTLNTGSGDPKPTQTRASHVSSVDWATVICVTVVVGVVGLPFAFDAAAAWEFWRHASEFISLPLR